MSSVVAKCSVEEPVLLVGADRKVRLLLKNNGGKFFNDIFSVQTDPMLIIYFSFFATSGSGTNIPDLSKSILIRNTQDGTF